MAAGRRRDERAAAAIPPEQGLQHRAAALDMVLRADDHPRLSAAHSGRRTSDQERAPPRIRPALRLFQLRHHRRRLPLARGILGRPQGRTRRPHLGGRHGEGAIPLGGDAGADRQLRETRTLRTDGEGLPGRHRIPQQAEDPLGAILHSHHIGHDRRGGADDRRHRGDGVPTAKDRDPRAVAREGRGV